MDTTTIIVGIQTTHIHKCMRHINKSGIPDSSGASEP